MHYVRCINLHLMFLRGLSCITGRAYLDAFFSFRRQLTRITISTSDVNCMYHTLYIFYFVTFLIFIILATYAPIIRILLDHTPPSKISLKLIRGYITEQTKTLLVASKGFVAAKQTTLPLLFILYGIQLQVSFFLGYIIK